MRVGVEPVLEVEDLRVIYDARTGPVAAVGGVDLRLEAREVVGVVGESGSGKSTLAWSIVGLVPRPGRIVGGKVTFLGRNLLQCADEELRRIRGRDIALITQATRSGLNPLMPIGAQIQNVYRTHKRATAREARERVLEMLERMALPDPLRVTKSYPHEVSGGMAQRAIIAMALICSPKLVIADEPTTGLDVTVQVQILDLISRLSEDLETATLLITHDLSVVAQYCQRIVVLRFGEVVEASSVLDFFASPRSEYGRKLLEAMGDRDLSEAKRG